MKISYLITCSTETDVLQRLIKKVYDNLGSDELVILQDEDHWNPQRKKYLYDITEFKPAPPEIISLPIYVHPLNNDYGEHKNWGSRKCTGDFIFQIDADELPPEALLGDNLRSILQSNPDIDLYFVPRINDQRGVTEADAKEFGWGLVYLPEYENGKVPLISWPDYQSRIYRNSSSIKWVNRLHERIEGHSQYSILPPELNYALIHDKSIETARNTNRKYHALFTETENLKRSK